MLAGRVQHRQAVANDLVVQVRRVDGAAVLVHAVVVVVVAAVLGVLQLL